jgi:hypothetical protein
MNGELYQRHLKAQCKNKSREKENKRFSNRSNTVRNWKWQDRFVTGFVRREKIRKSSRKYMNYRSSSRSCKM